MLGHEDKNSKNYEDEKEKDETELMSNNHTPADSLENLHNSTTTTATTTQQGMSNSVVDNKTVEEMGLTNHHLPTKSDLATQSSPSQIRKIPGIKREDSAGEEIISASLTADAVDSVASDWMSFRNIRQCVCSTPFDHFSRKVSVVGCFFLVGGKGGVDVV